MSQKKNPKGLPDDCASCTLSMLRVSPRKLNLLAQMIRGKSVEKALNALSFSSKKIAIDVKKALLSAVSNAENNNGLDVDRLVVIEATVGKKMSLKRLDIKARSKSGRICKIFSRIRIVVQEKEGVVS